MQKSKLDDLQRFHNAIEDTLVNALWLSFVFNKNGGTGAISTAFAPVLSHAKIARDFACSH